jgi:hypothetical protein
MAFGNLGKVIAGQALEATKKNVMDAITGPEPLKPAEKSPPPAPVESIGGTILGQIQAMQRPLRDDQELVVLFHTGNEVLRVTEILVPSLHLFVLAGVDSEHNITRAIVPAEKAQIVCKIKKVAPEAKPVRVTILSARPKPDNA